MRLPQTVGARLAFENAAIKIRHHFLCCVVRNAPQTHYQRGAAGQREGPSQAKDALTVLNIAKSCLASGKNCKFGRRKV